MIQKKNPQQQEKAPEATSSGKTLFTPGTPASVEEIIGRTGTRGGITQVRIKVLDGRDKSKILRQIGRAHV